MLELSDRDLKLIRAIVGNYIGNAEDNKPHSGVDQLLMGGVIMECRKLVDAIDTEIAENEPEFVPSKLTAVEG